MIWFDITTALFCQPPAIGIPRVEVSIANEFLILIDERTRFCIYESELGVYSEIGNESVRAIYNLHRGIENENKQFAVRRNVNDRNEVLDVVNEGDTIISIGFNWRPNFGNLPKLYQLKKQINIKIITFCYDMIPIKFTHWVPGMEKMYEPHIRGMAENSDHIFCISHNTMRDLFEWTQSQNIKTPAMSVVPFGASFKSNDYSVSPSEKIKKIITEPYLLTVCTIETRKSHETLTRSYSRLIERGITQLPKLVFVGGIGQGGKEFLESVYADKRISGYVETLHGVSDSDLSMLYRSCLFTLYPSLYEGWGLPISESLAHGKFCIAGTGSSLPEAGGYFVEYADPWDIEKWAGLMLYYCNENIRGKKEKIIKTFFKPTEWVESAMEILKTISNQ